MCVKIELEALNANFFAIHSHFHSIDEPRQASKITYPLFDVLFLTIAAVIAGAEGWEDIEDFGRCHLDWLKQHGDFSLGIPVHDTIARLVSRVDPGQFQQAFIAWMQQTEAYTPDYKRLFPKQQLTS